MRSETFLQTVLRCVILCLAVTPACYSADAQSVKDFFVPGNGYNHAVYNDSMGGSFEIQYNSFAGGVEVVRGDFFRHHLISLQKKKIKFSRNEAVLISEQKRNFWPAFDKEVVTRLAPKALNKDGNEVISDPPCILLKLPAATGSVSWTKDTSKYQITYTSSWTKVLINGQSKNAIKLVERVRNWQPAYSAEYYVEGIGFWKREIGDGKGSLKTSDMLKDLQLQKSSSPPPNLSSVAPGGFITLSTPIRVIRRDSSVKGSAKHTYQKPINPQPVHTKPIFMEAELNQMAIVRIKHLISLDLIAEACLIDWELLRRWNADYDLFVYNSCPEDYYGLHIPKDKMDIFVAKEAMLIKKSAELFKGNNTTADEK